MRTPLLLLALVACGSRTGLEVDGTEMLSVTCWFDCTATRVEYCNVNCGTNLPTCFPETWSSGTPPLTIPTRVNLCLGGTTAPADGIAACMATGGAGLQNVWLENLGIRREWPCGMPDPGSALPAPRWSPASFTVDGFSCTPRPASSATTARTVCYSP